MHNKTVTADAIATLFGGRNIGDEYFAANTEVMFGDMDALAVGPIAGEVSSQFDQELLNFAFRVELDPDGDLQWVTLRDGEEERPDQEPDTDGWERTSTGIMSVLAPNNSCKRQRPAQVYAAVQQHGISRPAL